MGRPSQAVQGGRRPGKAVLRRKILEMMFVEADMNDPIASSVQRLISGGQTGADRAALDVALALDIPHGGWVPRGRRAEDGPLDARYQMQETPYDEVSVRTLWNVRDSDATVIFTHGPLMGGSALTWECAVCLHKPCLHLDLNDGDEAEALARLRSWLRQHHPRTLNVAGPRASADPNIYGAVRRVLEQLLAR